jgi:hypothetical protein
LDSATTSFLLSGCSLIVGGLTPDGEPFATRGWGIRLVGDDRSSVRVVVGTADLARLEPAAVAVTGADVPTLRSLQLKGTVEAVEPLDDEDVAQHRSFCDQFFADVQRTDGIPRSLMERLVPADRTVVVLRVRQLFDQTPGPNAGRPIASSDG